MIVAMSVLQLSSSPGGKQSLFAGCASFLGGAAMRPPVCTTLWFRTARAVREPRGRGQKPLIGGGGRGGGDGGESAAKVLTAELSRAAPASAILSLAGKEVDGSIFNYFHMAATFSRLAKFSQRRQLGPSDVASPVWPRLVTRLRAMLKNSELPARATSQVLWAIGELHDQLYGKVKEYDERLLMELMRHTQKEAGAMDPQNLSNCLLTLAKCGDAMPDMHATVKSISKHMERKVRDFNPQDFSNSLWAIATLRDASPQILTAVPAIAESLRYQVEGMKTQELTNSLWAAANLQDAAPQVLTAVPAIAERMAQKVQGMNPQELSNSLWAAAKLKKVEPKVLATVPALVAQIPSQISSMVPVALQMSLWAASELGEGDLAAQLDVELDRRKR